ncbi:quinol dehydrogenase ferredoxin subunit NapH [Helicobacter mustelae]|uniref:Putative NapH protein (Putative ferredoxin) n=1 Tax=Helicobacter mustelae (strain ATCC 43772 / CCUG 25715 / CIP 103759 / LMG 18044 / NCTC 12198 / R85-136P) TaxID=679897 RepID=D3UIP1_HELM1|nr:quinol dehydrogenase ferredoxin subunit NapH [Helicobacter mustelae]CBG40366.1 putative NapH protein (putative ferredoxin) [Helicobacter mustelae 12198]SQH71865.1 NapH protein [Helicobacter mustelae]STP13004.1 NapH protein [Helicobacter mustelae]
MQWLIKNKFLIIRRTSQIGILLLFFLANCSLITIGHKKHLVLQGDLSGFESGERNLAIANTKEALLKNPILQGNLSTSKIFDKIPMSDPLAFLQIFLAGGAISFDLLLGVGVVLALYGIFLGRGFCAFVCPINLITDLANLLRRILRIENIRFISFSRNTKYIILALALVLSFAFGMLAWESINPISMLHRGVVFGMGTGFFGVLTVFLFDLFMLKNGFCGHLCPLGATYSIIGAKSLLKVQYHLNKCTKCMQCIRICPESQVLHLIGKQSGFVTKTACIKCGRCIEVCNDDALNFNILHFNKEKK